MTVRSDARTNSRAGCGGLRLLSGMRRADNGSAVSSSRSADSCWSSPAIGSAVRRLRPNRPRKSAAMRTTPLREGQEREIAVTYSTTAHGRGCRTMSASARRCPCEGQETGPAQPPLTPAARRRDRLDRLDRQRQRRREDRSTGRSLSSGSANASASGSGYQLARILIPAILRPARRHCRGFHRSVTCRTRTERHSYRAVSPYPTRSGAARHPRRRERTRPARAYARTRGCRGWCPRSASPRHDGPRERSAP